MRNSSIDIKNLLQRKFYDKGLVCESGASGHLPHLFQDGKMTFNEMKQIFHDIFTGQANLEEKIDGMNINITYKDGKFGAARNKESIKEPMDLDKLAKFFDGKGEVKTAFVKSMNDLQKALSSIEADELNRIFANGYNFLACEIVYPPAKNLIDYGNKCLLQINGVNVFNDSFEKISEDKEAGKKIYDLLKAHKALKQEMFEITRPNVLRIKNSVNAGEALDQLMADLTKLVDGIGFRATINDYVKDKYCRYVVNAAMQKGIDVDKDCDWTSEVVDRFSNVSGRRPTKADLNTYAKKAGIDTRSDSYKELMEYLKDSAEETNIVIMQPVEDLVMKAGVMLIKNLVGFMAADPAKTSQKLVTELEDTISYIQNGEAGLTVDKLKRFQKNLKKLEKWQKFAPFSEGVIINWKGKLYKITGSFGPWNQISGLLKYKR